MIKTLSDVEAWQISDNIALVQALERCAAAYRNRCLSELDGEYPSPMWVRLYSATERLKQAVCKNTVCKTNVARTLLKIGSNLMGCNDMAIVELHADSCLSLLAGSGMTAGGSKRWPRTRERLHLRSKRAISRLRMHTRPMTSCG